jgi:hypothetical protein
VPSSASRSVSSASLARSSRSSSSASASASSARASPALSQLAAGRERRAVERAIAQQVALRVGDAPLPGARLSQVVECALLLGVLPQDRLALGGRLLHVAARQQRGRLQQPALEMLRIPRQQRLRLLERLRILPGHEREPAEAQARVEVVGVQPNRLAQPGP